MKKAAPKSDNTMLITRISAAIIKYKEKIDIAKEKTYQNLASVIILVDVF